MSTFSPSTRVAALTLGLAAALWVGLWAFAGLDSLISEDWYHLGIAAEERTWRAAFDVARVPLRPLQHFAFHALAQLDSPSPGAARLVGLGGHVVALFALYPLALRWIGDRRGALMALVLFALAPNVFSVLSPAALGWPWRVAFSLLALLAFERYWSERRAGYAVAAIALWLVALGFHQGALIVPGLAALRVLVLGDGDGRRRFDLSPGLVAWCALACGYVVYLLFVRDVTGHGLKEVATLPPNVVRASLALFPEPLRIQAVAGLRADTLACNVLGGVLLLVPLATFAWALLFGSRLSKFIVLAIGLELLLPVLTTGFMSRYAYLGFALAAVGVAGVAHRGGAYVGAFWLTAVVWGLDCARDADEFRCATAAAAELIDVALEARERTPEGAIALVDVPERWGREQELNFFGIGLERALELSGGAGPWCVLRTWTTVYTTDVHAMAPEEIERREARGEFRALRWDVVGERLVPAL
ncbi:MAG: hypothetical protein WD226_06505 [Planctomycetota bacterium]